MTGIEGGSSSSSCDTARHSHWFGFKNENTSQHCVRFLLFKPRLIRQTYTERRRLTPEYVGLNTHTYQRAQLTKVTNIIEREFVATAILSLCCVSSLSFPGDDVIFCLHSCQFPSVYCLRFFYSNNVFLFDLVWSRLSRGPGWIRSRSVHVR